MARVIRAGGAGTDRLTTIAVLRDCIAAMGWTIEYDDVAVSGSFTAMSVGETCDTFASPCCLIFSLGDVSYLQMDLCTWVATDSLAARSRTNYDLDDPDDAQNVSFAISDGAHTINVMGNKDMLFMTVDTRRIIVARLDEHYATGGVVQAQTVVGSPVQLGAGQAANFVTGGSYLGISHPRGGVSEGYRFTFSVTAVDALADTIDTTLTASLGSGSIVGANPFPWIVVDTHSNGSGSAMHFTVPSINYSSAGAYGDIENTTEFAIYLRPSSVRHVPSSGTPLPEDRMTHGARAVYPVFISDHGASYGSSSYLRLAMAGSEDDFFGVNQAGQWPIAGATSTTIPCSGAAWETDEHAGRVVYLSGGGMAVVLSNTADTLTVDEALPTIPADGETASVFDAFYQITLAYSPGTYFAYFSRLAIKAV